MGRYVVIFLFFVTCSLPLNSFAEGNFIKPLDITENRNAAAAFALTNAFILLAVNENCHDDFDNDHKSWVNRNKEYLDAAKGWMLYVKSMISITKNEDAAKKFYYKTIEEMKNTARKGIEQSVIRNGKQKLCENFKRVVESRKFDFAVIPMFQGELKEIKMFHSAMMEGKVKY